MYKFDLGNDFVLEISEREEILNETFVAPTDVVKEKPCCYEKRRKVHYFKSIHCIKYKNYEIATGTFAVIDLMGYFKNYVQNKLHVEREYIEQNERANYTIKTTNFKIDGTHYEMALQIVLLKTEEKKYLCKIMAANIVDKVQKVMSKCEIDYKREAYKYER